MDPLTHALSGALLARATAPARAPVLPLRTRLAAGFVAALFPDVDAVLRLAGTLTYLNWHQGPTHALVLLPLWAFVLARLFARLGRRHPWRAYFPVACAGLAIHIAGDLITSYGLMLFAPLSTTRYSVPLAFLFDPWMTVLVAAGLVAAAWLPQGRAAAVVALAAVAGYVAFLAVQHQRALAIAEARRAELRMEARVHALAQPLSPRHWMLLVQDDTGSQLGFVRLGGTPPAWTPYDLAAPLRALRAAYRPPERIAWQDMPRFGNDPGDAALAREAWAQPALAPFRRFAAYPALDRIERGDNETCVRFLDQRYLLPTLPASFRYGACRAHTGGPWRLERSRGTFWID